MKLKILFLTTILSVSCSTGFETDGTQSIYDLKADIDIFLSTTDSDLEAQVLKRLKKKKVSHEAIKTILRQRPKPAKKKQGLQTGLKFKNKGKN